MKNEIEIESDGVLFKIKAVKRCRSSMYGRWEHHYGSDDGFWIHRDDHSGHNAKTEIRVFMCACKDCEHGAVVPEAFISSREFALFRRMRASWIERAKEGEIKRQHRAAEVQALSICERIADEGYTEGISYEIKEMIGGIGSGNMLIAIPSKGRIGRVKTLKVLPNAVLYVPQVEVNGYLRAYPASKIVGVPMATQGITKTRNWILDNTDERYVVFIDDDVVACGYFELYPFQAHQRRLREDAWLAEWWKLFEVTEDMKYRVWGLSTDGALRSVYPYRPFIFHTYVTASCMGIINDHEQDRPLRFDERYKVKEDYELCLRCIKEDGGIVGARHLFWRNSHWGDEGGCKDYRTQAVEEEAIKMLIETYPGMIKQITRGGSEYSIEMTF